MSSTMRTLSGGCGDESDDNGGDVSDDDDEICLKHNEKTSDRLL